MSRNYKDTHRSVMVHEALDFLIINRKGKYVDCTVGEGGHLAFLANEIGSDSRLIGLDIDIEVLQIAKEKLEEFRGFVELFNVSYVDFDLVLDSLKIEQVDGFLLDLGVSTFQLKARGRGFSYEKDETLDMRMDPGTEFTAKDVVNNYSEPELSKVIFEYGQEKRFARRIARSIIKRRPLYTTFDLVEAIKKALPPKFRYGRRHFATKTFQAIRIEVNQELKNIGKTLYKIPHYLKPGGRVVVISFHSLEDGVVKRTFRDLQGGELNVLTKKPLTPSENEVEQNPRARSAKLRAAERI
ncbi:MAG: 16S rRNA (cytosine(1402)-N(4))-methyltransferase RsmH [Petrotogales bacterium]